MMNTPLIKFPTGSPIMIAGPTGCGKTYFTCKLLKNNMFQSKIGSILYCYGVYHDYFDEMLIDIPNIEFHEGIPTESKIRSLNNGQFNVIVQDDLMEIIIKNIETQNLFYQILSPFQYNCNFPYSKCIC